MPTDNSNAVSAATGTIAKPASSAITHPAHDARRKTGRQDGKQPGAEVQRKGESDARLVALQSANDGLCRTLRRPDERLGTRHVVAHGRLHIARHDDVDAYAFGRKP